MAEVKSVRLNKVIKELNISLDRAVTFLAEQGIEIDARPNTKIEGDIYEMLVDEFDQDKSKKLKAEAISIQKQKEKEALRAEQEKEEEEAQPAQEEVIRAKADMSGPKTVGKIDLDGGKAKEEEEEVVEEQPVDEEVAEEPVEEAPAAEVVEETAEVEEPAAEEVAEVEEAPAAETEETPAEQTEPAKAETEAEAAPEAPAAEKVEEPAKESEKTEESATDSGSIKTQYKKLDGPKFVGKTIDLDQFKPKKKKVASSSGPKDDDSKKRRRKRISSDTGPAKGRGAQRRGGKNIQKEEPTEEEIQKQIKETLDKLTNRGKSKSSKNRRDKREERREREQMEEMKRAEEGAKLKVTEFVTVAELATMMSVPTTRVIASCMELGIMVTMNQRLDAETLSIVAEEFGYEVEFVSADVQEAVQEEEDDPADLMGRAPIVTVMGHVDHGKTSLLDYVRDANVIAGESGGITQHIGAYSVSLDSGQRIAFIDTPGHEAFTAMRARGAQVTDIAIIVIAADDAVMPQTKEAISHAQAAGVPIVFALNKVDRDAANPEKIKEELAGMNLLVEDWGGKYQSQEVSAKTGLNVKELLEKVLLEAELLDLKANPKRLASGSVVEATLDKGRGYTTTILVQNGTLRIGDYILAGQYSGKVKAMFDERSHPVTEAGPSTPVSILGLDGAPQAGDKFKVMEDEREAKDIATKRQQLQREQSMRTQKHITLDEIGRRLAIGDFQELNIIVKGDVDGSIEALSDSLQKLSTEEIQVNIIHKAVGAVTESDVLLASASDAIIVAFQVRPSMGARKLAETEQIDIRTYSIIYDAINEIKDAMEGMLSAELKEEIVANLEIRETFKISKVGTIAGCMVLDGKIHRNNDVRIIRDGVVIYTGKLGSLKRFKDDVKEVAKGFECGLNIENFNDIKVGDIIEAYQEVEVKRTLE
ncbi:translation initiation factor IF-2 [Cryomorphaceae bacterium]|nr:translation initiation factor IF-2 [Cryomorphaceae bacterium]